MQPLRIFNRSPTELVRNPNNARTHSPKQLKQIAASIRRFGFNNPIIVDEANVIIAGHGRVAAAELLGIQTVPTVRLAHLTEAQKRAYIIADNRLAELAGWDREVLRVELQHLLLEDGDFEVTDIGFSTAEIDIILSGDAGDTDHADGEVEGFRDGPPIARPGDLWLLGPHRLFCGDSLLGASYATLLGEEKAQMVFTDPPYNVRISGHVSGLGKARHREFEMASGELTEGEFTRFLSTALRQMAASGESGSIHYICMDWRHLPELLRAGRIAYTELKNVCVWVKSTGGMGSLYRSQHELVCVFKSGTGAHINNVQLGQHGRNRTNVWEYAGLNSFQTGRDDTLAMHPTVKPVAMVADAMLDCSSRGGIILDPFSGTGTTIVAADRVGRAARGIELDPLYVDVSLRRVRRMCGIEPIHAATGQTLSDLETVHFRNLSGAEPQAANRD